MYLPLMSEDQLKALIDKVKSGTETQIKLGAAESSDAAIAIAKATGFSTTAEDFQSIQSAPVELEGEELKGAAGSMRSRGLTSPIKY